MEEPLPRHDTGFKRSNEPALAPLTSDESRELGQLMRKLREINCANLFVPVARLQLLHAVSVADQLKSEDTEAWTTRMQYARGVAYNIASFNWPGWGWSDVGDVSEERRELGHSGARTGLQIAEAINDVTSNILWINGAHSLAARDYETALDQFQQAEQRDQTDVGPLMHRGWIALTRLLQHPHSDRETAYQTALSNLEKSGLEHAEFFSKQLVTARKVFSEQRSSRASETRS
ncbi:MAG: hypothetical protein J4F97_04105 [Pseudomonadales bacterium]|nr:hypothetical protein [Pseudomonadales bacterium]